MSHQIRSSLRFIDIYSYASVATDCLDRLSQTNKTWQCDETNTRRSSRCASHPAASVLGIAHSVSVDGKHGFSLRQAGRVIDFTDPRFSSALPQVQAVKKRALLVSSSCGDIILPSWIKTHRVVEAWARMLPPIGFLGSAENMAAPSTCATTWLVITTATPNCWQVGQKLCLRYMSEAASAHPL